MTSNVRTDLVSSELMVLLRNDPERGLSQVYRRFKPEYLNFIRHYGGDQEMHLDSYHDAVLGFYEVYNQGKYDPDKAGIKTLLFTIGKYRLLSRLDKEKRSVLKEEMDFTIPIEALEPNDNSEYAELASDVISKLGDKCRKIIELFYYRRLTIAEIVVQLGYKNENVVKAHKSRCMKNLRARVETRMQKRGNN